MVYRQSLSPCESVALCLFMACDQAAVGVKGYQWRVVGTRILVPQLLGVIEGCLIPDPVARWTVPQVLEALSTLQREAAAIRLADAVGGSPKPQAPPTVVSPPVPPTSPTSAVVYDALAMVDALAAVGVDDSVIDVVADAIGHLAVSTLDVLKACGVPPMKGMTARRLLTPCERFTLVSNSGRRRRSG